MPRSGKKSALPSSETVGISIISCSSTAMVVGGLTTTMMKLFYPGIVMVLLNSRIEKSGP